MAAAAYQDGDAGALAVYDEDMRDQYESTLARAVARRTELTGYWRNALAHDDRIQRRGWIAFNDYFI